MIYRDNTAYDFEMFAPKKTVVELPDHPNAKKKRASATAKKPVAKASARSNFVMVALVVVAFLLIIAQINCQLQNSEMVDKIADEQTEIQKLQSENTRLQVEVNNKVSFSNMENTAKSMGMQKITVAQVEYVNLCTEDAVEVTDGENGFLTMLADWF